MYTPPVATTDRTILRGIWTGICLEGRSSGWFEGCACRERAQAWSFRGSKSRNKVSVGEPAEGSLPILRVLLANSRRDFALRRADVPPRASTASGPSESASTESIAARREKGGNALYPRPTLFRVAKGRRLFSLFFLSPSFSFGRGYGRDLERGARRSSPCEARRVDFRKLGASLASKSLVSRDRPKSSFSPLRSSSLPLDSRQGCSTSRLWPTKLVKK